MAGEARDYGKRFGSVLWRECHQTARYELLASLLVSATSYTISAHYRDPMAWENFKIVIYSNLVVLGAFILFHLARTPSLVHAETVNRVTKETEDRLKKQSLKPEFRTKIDCAIWDYTNGDRLYVHVHIVNASEVSSTIRRIALISTATDGAFNALPFNKASLMRRGQSRLDVSIKDGEIVTYKESKILDPFIDSLEILTSSTFARGEGKKGWLMFPLRHSFEAGNSLSLFLSVEDAFGDLHDSEPSSVSIESGSVFV